RHPAPTASIHPDRSKGWIRRIWPFLRARRGMFTLALALSAVSMAASVAVPRVVGLAINEGLDDRSTELAPYVWVLVALAVVRAVTTLASRFYLFKVAYGLEYDRRVTMYQHLSRQSFTFFDRVQSGQLISRANS